MTQLRQTYSIIKLDALRRNIRAMRHFLPSGVKLMMVVKADAYGHGIIPVSRLAQEEKIECLGVAIAEEGMVIREAGIRLPVLVFGALNQGGMDASAVLDLTVTLTSAQSVRMAQLAAQRAHKPINAHIKLDTGMNRIGMKTEEELLAALEMIKSSHDVCLCGAFTHFADAGSFDSSYTDIQFRRFMALSKLLPQNITLHVSATGGIIFKADAGFDMVRSGIGLYGYSPKNSPIQFEPCLRLCAEVVFVKTIQAGESVGYGCTFTAKKSMKIATLAIGYGDGYGRQMSNRGRVLIHGVSCPIVGLVCMDQFMVDVSRAENVQPGDEAVLIGKQNDQFIGADEVAEYCGTIPYEVLLSISGRVPKIYVDAGEEK